jgi:hypothetical protein
MSCRAFSRCLEISHVIDTLSLQTNAYIIVADISVRERLNLGDRCESQLVDLAVSEKHRLTCQRLP